MIGGCFTSTAYPFKADVYEKKRVLDPNTGQIRESWVFGETISLRVRAFKSTSYNAQGTNELFEEIYVKQNYLKIFTKDPVRRDLQITNIRRVSDGQVVFRELELKGQPPTWFNTNGSAPVLDPFGKEIEWDTMIERATEQGGL